MTSPSLCTDTAAGPVYATAGPCRGDAIVFELKGAVRGSVHVTGTTHPRHWDQFTAVRACLGPVNEFKSTAPDEALPRLAHSRTGYRGSLTLYSDDLGLPQVSVYPIRSASDHDPSQRTRTILTCVLRACAEHVAQHADLPVILDASRQRDTPGLLRFLTWSADHHQATAARLKHESLAALRAQRAAVALWWTAARWFTRCPHPVLLLMLADLPGSLPRRISVAQWMTAYGPRAASDEHALARRDRAESASLRAQQRSAPRARRASAANST
ncbi:hypothetical protein [Streptomyces formicae]